MRKRGGDEAGTRLDVAGTPRRIEVMQCIEPGPHIRADAHLGVGPEKHPDQTVVNRLEEPGLLGIRVDI